MNTNEAHEHSANHREEVESSETCGCFYCAQTYPTGNILDWTDGGETALCPYCGIDSVIGDKSGVPLTKEFLTEMYDVWFGHSVSAKEFKANKNG